MGQKVLKIIHTADFHLGVSFRRIIGRNVNETRREDFRKNIKKIFDIAIERDVDLILISGDIFHRSDPSNRDFVFIANQIGRATEKGIYVVAIAGNHDKPKTIDSHNPLQALVEAHAPHFYYFPSTPQKPLVININKENIRAQVGIVPIPFIDPRIVYQIGDENYSTFIGNLISMLLDKLPSTIDYKILMAHLTVRGSQIRRIWSIQINEPDVARSDLKEHEFDYIALGHIHTPQEISKRIIYPGSIERIDFSEADESKSIVYVELSDSGIRIERIPLECRPMISIDTIKIEDQFNPMGVLIDNLDRINIPPGSLLRLQIETSESVWRNLEKYIDALEKYLFDGRRVLGYFIKRRMLKEAPSEKDISSQIVSLREAVLEYIKAMKIDARVKERALELAKRIMDEVNIP